MASSYVEYTGDGTQTDWAVPFPYIDEAHVHIYFDGVEQTTGLSWPSSGVLRSAAAGAGVAVLVKRITPDAALVNFNNRNNLTADNLSTAGLQAIYRAVEAADRAAQSIALDALGVYDFGGKRASNVGTPTEDGDLVPKSYADTVITTAQGYANDAEASATSAATHDASSATHDSNASANATLAQQWATKTDGEVVAGQGYGAKKYAQDAATSAGEAGNYAAAMANPWHLAGDWDASSGSFPATKTVDGNSVAVSKGDVFIVSAEGTVDGHLFTAGDTLIAKVDTPSTSTFDANWISVQGGVTADEIINALGYTPVATSYEPGDIRQTMDDTAPAGWVELDGSVITGGATNNPNVAARYAWMVVGSDLHLPDFRGRVPRGWAHGSSVDPDRASRSARAGDGQTGDYPGTYQGDDFKSHSHPTPGSSGTAYNQSAVEGGHMLYGGSHSTSAAGGNETRMVNINVMFQMKLG